MSKHIVAPVSELPPGARKLVHVKGRPIAVFSVGGEFFGINNRCPHQGGSLCDGDQVGLVTSDSPGTYKCSRAGEFIRCPWHGWQFDLRTGQSWCDPDKFRTKSYELRIEPGGDLARGPHLAETYPVSVDDQYVVVEL